MDKGFKRNARWCAFLRGLSGKYKSAVFIVCTLLQTSLLFGQNDTITGVVYDENAVPIIGATLLQRGTTNGTLTDVEGKYSIVLVEGEKVLIVRYSGMEMQEIALEGRSVLDVIMNPDLVSLNEFVVVGYGSQDKRDISGAVSVVDKEDLDLRPNTQVGALIQGKAAGVQVLSSSGKPSQGINIRIRGVNSINAGSEPLYVVDGVPTLDTRSINPADIESISILKDASAAAIYGSQGANGVVLITTKMGSRKGSSVTFDSYVGFSEIWKTIPVLDARDYRILMTEMRQSTDWSLYTEDTDWQDMVFDRGTTQNYQLSATGKQGNTSYYLSGGWIEQNGAVRSSQMRRSNFKINFDHDVNDWLKIGTRLAYTIYEDVDVTDNTNVNSGGVLLGALTTPPNIGVFNTDGTYTSNPFQNWENPYASTDGTQRLFTNQRVIGNVYTQMCLLPGLSLRTNLGVDNNNSTFDSFLDPFKTSFGRALNGRAISFINRNSFYIFDNTLTYTKTLGKSNFDFLAGAVTQEYRWEDYGITTQNFASAGITTPNAGSDLIAATGSKSEKANQSFIGRVNYEYNTKYLMTVNFRADGSSVFGPENRWGYFPSMSAGWRLSEESFLQNFEKLSELKLRTGWGITGNDQIGNNYAYLGLVGGGANYPLGGSVQPGTFPASISNNTLRWEESSQTNIGLDVSFFQDRLGLTLDYYIRTTNDLLLNAPLPRSTGFDNAIQNVGSLENRGFEVALNTVNIQGEKLTWTTNLNFSINRNKVLNLVGQQLFIGGIAGRGEASLVQEGLPLGILYGYIYGGVDPSTGDAFYINKEGESVFDPTPEDRVVIGDANPDFIYGITNTLQYGNWTLVMFLQGSQGNDILNATRIDIEGMTDPKNQSTAVLDRWQQEGDQTDIPRASWGNTDNSRISTRFIEDGSYLRLKTLTLGYGFSNTLLKKLKISEAKLYLTGENLLTFTNYTGFDPEVNAFGGSNTARGIDYGTYPQTRNVIVGIRLTL